MNLRRAFASPEQLQTCRVDVASEIYSLGSTMWFLLAGGAPPFESGSGEPELTRSFRAIPREVRPLISSMRNPEPEQRPIDPVLLAGLHEECLARFEGRPTRISL